jgi:hypothetical protein
MSVPRGYTKNDVLFNYNSAKKFSVEYALPLLYPNFSVGPVAYFKRIQANLFYDYFNYSLINNKDIKNNLSISSAGVEIGIETNLFRFYWTFVPTIRCSYLLESGKTEFKFLLSTRYSFSLGKISNYRIMQAVQ